mmetsp:Transcript_77709/g.177953  ORF Transcript_77709/g.177953 Transcript_77709/m.177953 type:complete len:203 (-) Transcript_77709:27-635(-)
MLSRLRSSAMELSMAETLARQSARAAAASSPMAAICRSSSPTSLTWARNSARPWTASRREASSCSSCCSAVCSPDSAAAACPCRRWSSSQWASRSLRRRSLSAVRWSTWDWRAVCRSWGSPEVCSAWSARFTARNSGAVLSASASNNQSSWSLNFPTACLWDKPSSVSSKLRWAAVISPRAATNSAMAPRRARRSPAAMGAT